MACMICRAIKDRDNVHNVVWFGSCGIDANGHAIKADNFSTDADYIKDVLTQKLQIIKSELWTDVDFGVPLFDKVKIKSEMDASVADIVLGVDGVTDIKNIESRIEGSRYFANVIILSQYGQIVISL